MSNKWKIASFAVMLLGCVYNMVDNIVESKNAEAQMREIAREEIENHEKES